MKYRVAVSQENRVKLFAETDLATSLTKTSAIKPVKIKGVTTHVVNKSFHARTIVLGNGCGSECRPEFPAFIELKMSAPAGSDIQKLKDLLLAAVAADDFYIAQPTLSAEALTVI